MKTKFDRKLLIPVTILALMMGLIVGTVAGAPGDFEPDTGFEIDGNIDFDGPGGTYDWWDGVANRPAYPPAILIADAHSKNVNDDYFSPSGKFDDPAGWSIKEGSVGPGQNELTNVFVWALAPGDVGNTDSWLIMGMERVKKSGTFALDFEFNQEPWGFGSLPHVGGPNRTPGDIAVGFELKGNPTSATEDLQVLIVQFMPEDLNQCVNTIGNGNKLLAVGTGTDACLPYGDTGWYYRFLDNAAILASSGLGTATMNAENEGFSRASFTPNGETYTSYDPQGNQDDYVGEFEFAEAAINLTALGLEPGCPGFGSVHAKSRSSLEVGSDLKDLAGPRSLPVKCYIEGYKYLDINGNGDRDDGEPGLNGWTIDLSDGSSTTTANDANGDPGYYRFDNLEDGTFTVSEVCTNQGTGWVQTEPYKISDPDLLCGDGTHTFTIDIDNRIKVGDFGNGKPAIELEKTCDAAVFLGDTVTYTYKVTNPGGASYPFSVELVNVKLVDDHATPGDTGDDFEPTYKSGDSGNIGILDPDETWVYQYTWEPTAAGSYKNTASVSGDFGGSTKYASVNASDDCTTNVYELTVTKDATTSYTRTYHWSIEKTVTPSAWQLFTGESGESQYTVKVTKTGFTDSAWAVSGEIKVSNEGNPIAAEIAGVSDVVSPDIAASVDCGTATFPYTLAAGATLTCSYSRALPNAATRTNTATATLTNGTGFSGSANVEFDPGNPTSEVFSQINVTDDFATPDDPADDKSWGPVSEDTSWTYIRTFTCDADEGKFDNTATIVETKQSDSASVTVDCYQLQVTKDATPFYKRYYDWKIVKLVEGVEEYGPVQVFPGGSVDVTYTIEVGISGISDGDWAVSGEIKVSNAGNPIAAEIEGVSDLVSPGIAASVDCGTATFPYTLAAGATLTCSYSTALPDGSNRTNTATAQQNLYNYPFGTAPTSAGSTSYDGTADIIFGDPSELVDEFVDVTDDFGTPGDPADDRDFGRVYFDNDPLPVTFSYTRTISVADTFCGEFQIDNTATLVEVDTNTIRTDSATVKINAPCEGCTPGFWQGGAGSQLWNDVNDPQWTYSGTNPFIHTTLFNNFFDVVTDTRLDDFTMYALVSTGGGDDPAHKAARDMVAAYLNESAFGNTFPADSIDALLTMWYNAVAGGDAGFDAFHAEVSGWNDPPEGGTCPLP